MIAYARWIDARLSDWATRLDLEVERVLVDTTEDLLQAIRRTRVTQRQIAEKLGRAESFVSRALRGDQNLTLKTLALLSYAAGLRFRPRFEEIS